MNDFDKIELRVGRIVAVEDFPAARNPSNKLTIDVGPLGVRRSPAFDSAVLTLGAIEESKRVTLLQPDAECELGSPIG